jgi:simple sugar transport system permease protein
VGGAIGAFIFGMANKGIVYAQWNPDWFKFFLGLMLLLATIVNLDRQAPRGTQVRG